MMVFGPQYNQASLQCGTCVKFTRLTSFSLPLQFSPSEVPTLQYHKQQTSSCRLLLQDLKRAEDYIRKGDYTREGETQTQTPGAGPSQLKNQNGHKPRRDTRAVEFNRAMDDGKNDEDLVMTQITSHPLCRPSFRELPLERLSSLVQCFLTGPKASASRSTG
ncbi:hypothetical protein D9758_015911 [Tetrapyrgos nigripes]|uniref:Uncharacterized protein n=1 Tax=Tetrapyrgos nigripes TaxID=182062 RepID=A0A8H5CJ78_9AGAR|nr:hypothetical protein D9758_015911 [Tetrapyrgos nigripes]